ncbi:MAG: phosphatidate cytidylyltransferase [Ignavibacteria bacterium]|nr:phosphatidate cytidylyltransferase [Ignavibacteria bacterium]
MNTLTKRILVGVVGIPLAVATMYIGGWLFTAVVAAVSTIALWEYYTLVNAKEISANVWAGMVWNFIVIGTVTAVVESTGFDALNWVFLLVALVFLMPISILTLELFRNRPHPIFNSASTILGIIYVTPAFAALEFLRNAQSSVLVTSVGQWDGFIIVLALFVSVWACDTAAYFVGSKFGRNKILPRVSPNKSWQGAIAGAIAAVLSFVLITQYWLDGAVLVHSIAVGLIVGVMGQVGDFAESMLKRDAGVKDSSALIPGHGGMLDRFDSMIFVSTITLIYILIVTSIESLMEVH